MELGDDEVETGLATLLEEAHLNERWHLDAVPSAEEFVKEIQHLNPDKSGGPDGFHAGLLRPFGEEVGPMVQKVIQRSYRHSQWPQQWKSSPRRYQRRLEQPPGDNRCITVLNVMSRVAQKHQMRLIRNLCQPFMSELQHSNGALAGTQYPLFRLRQWITSRHVLERPLCGHSTRLRRCELQHTCSAVGAHVGSASGCRGIFGRRPT